MRTLIYGDVDRPVYYTFCLFLGWHLNTFFPAFLENNNNSKYEKTLPTKLCIDQTKNTYRKSSSFMASEWLSITVMVNGLYIFKHKEQAVLTAKFP
jgi:hypothetical protein